MYMFTQCSRQLGFFPPTLMFRAQIKGKYSLALYTVHFPIYVKSFLQEIRFSALIVPRSSRQAQETRSESFLQCVPCLCPNPLWLEWQFGRCQALEPSLSIDVHEGPGQTVWPAFLSTSPLGAGGGERQNYKKCPHRRLYLGRTSVCLQDGVSWGKAATNTWWQGGHLTVLLRTWVCIVGGVLIARGGAWSSKEPMTLQATLRILSFKGEAQRATPNVQSAVM